jgi:putative peptide zinc metalloprotease protein
MNQSTQTSEAIELANLRLRLRDGLQFDLREYGGEPCYVVKNRVSSEYFQIGITEYAFISLLDGATSLQEAVQQTAYQLGEEAFAIQDAVLTCQWLIQHGLADPVNDIENTAQTSLDYLLGEIRTRNSSRMVAQLNPLFFRLPLFNPQPVLRILQPALGWIASRVFFVIWVLVMVTALVVLFQQKDDLAGEALGLLTPRAWLWFVVTMIFMKFVHEFAHGVFCNRFGGQVREAGVVFILCWPIPYVDVTSCWSFPSRWRRIAVSSAGMYVELFIAGLATIGWSLTSDVVLKFHLVNIMLAGSLTTLLFNANFLMRFDGYYILSDLLEIPNLAQQGQQYLQYLGKRYLLGMRLQPAKFSRGRGMAIKTYGVLALCWRIVVYVSLSIIASALFFGFGIALSVLGGAMWLGVPLFRLGKLMMGQGQGGVVDWRRLAMVTVPAGLGLLAAMFVLPWPIQLSAPAFVRYEDPAVIRVQTPGFVEEIAVRNGEFVNAGDLLVQLRNHEVVAHLDALKADRQQSLLRSRRYHAERAIPAYQSEIAARLAIEKQIDEVSRKLDDLTLRTPVSGIVVGRQLDASIGQFVSPGTELLRIVDENRKEIVVSISQDYFDSFSDRKGQATIFVSSQAGDVCPGWLASIEPTASLNVDPRLATYAGGSLTVRTSATETIDGQADLELVQPRFRGTVTPEASASRQLACGITGYVRLGYHPDNLAVHVVKAARSWIRSLSEAAHREVSLAGQ